MKLNHIDLLVTDVQRTAAFLQEHFGMLMLSNPKSPAIAIMGDGAGFVLVLQRAEAGASYPKGFHVGFLVDSDAHVRELQTRARAAGAEVSDVVVDGRGTHSYFTAPDGFYVEVSCQRARPENTLKPVG